MFNYKYFILLLYQLCLISLTIFPNGIKEVENPSVATEFCFTSQVGFGYYKPSLEEPCLEMGYEVTVILGKTSISWSGDLTSGSFTDIYTAGGGIINYNDTGSWAYIYRNGSKIGFVCKTSSRYLDTEVIWDLCIGEEAKKMIESGLNKYYGIQIDTNGISSYPSIRSLLKTNK